jgi:23S rRNA-/tRNA-specific pseudouridylate synthase
MHRACIRVTRAPGVKQSLCTAFTSLPNIIHDSEDWFVIEKPPGWHSCELANKQSSHQRIVETWLRTNQVVVSSVDLSNVGTYILLFLESGQSKQNELPEAGMVNRLDEPTSG